MMLEIPILLFRSKPRRNSHHSSRNSVLNPLSGITTSRIVQRLPRKPRRDSKDAWHDFCITAKSLIARWKGVGGATGGSPGGQRSFRFCREFVVAAVVGFGF